MNPEIAQKIDGRIGAWAEQLQALYPHAAVRWCVDDMTPQGCERRIGVAFKSMKEPGQCIGFFAVSWGAFHVSFEESSVYQIPLSVNELPNFIKRELFRAAAGPQVKAVIGMVFDGGTEIVKHYKTKKSFDQDKGRIT